MIIPYKDDSVEGRIAEAERMAKRSFKVAKVIKVGGIIWFILGMAANIMVVSKQSDWGTILLGDGMMVAGLLAIYAFVSMKGKAEQKKADFLRSKQNRP